MSTSKWSVLLAILIVLLLPGLAVQVQPDLPAAPAGALIAEDATAQPVVLDSRLSAVVGVERGRAARRPGTQCCHIPGWRCSVRWHRSDYCDR